MTLLSAAAPLPSGISSIMYKPMYGKATRVGVRVRAKGRAFAKTGTTFDASGLKAQVLAGYIDAKSGPHLAFALYVNNVARSKA